MIPTPSHPHVGTVRWFSHTKGYGFILHAKTEQDVLVHHTHIKGVGFRILKQGEVVRYSLMALFPDGRLKAASVERSPEPRPPRIKPALIPRSFIPPSRPEDVRPPR